MTDGKDDFWDIDKLIPQNKPVPRAVAKARSDTQAVEIELGGDEARSDSRLTQISNTEKNDGGNAAAGQIGTPCDEYVPASPLISAVRIFKWKNNYNYYEQFTADAKKMMNENGAACERVPYFSYVPQYTQLSGAQRAWYLYWRGRVRDGEFLPTDYSYILLFIFEIINLSDLLDVVSGQRTLCELWRHYRREYPRLDRYLGEWICDYSLIHHIAPPPGFCDDGIAEYSTLKEFYVYYDGGSDNRGYAAALIRFCSSYDYRKSKFAVGDGKALFNKHIPGALAYVIEQCSESGHILSAAGLEDSTMTRDAYGGALCASEIKRRIEVEYCSFSRSHELRFLIADIIKYSENRIRAYLGVKSRLGIFSLPVRITENIDDYFRRELPIASKPFEAEQEKHDYDKYYHVPKTELSLEKARKIENNSWDTTNMLISAFDDNDDNDDNAEKASVAEMPKISDPHPMGDDTTPKEALIGILGDKYSFVKAAMSADRAAQNKIAERLGMLPDALADAVNSAAADTIGDIILEETDGAYTVIEDYREMFEDDR